MRYEFGEQERAYVLDVFWLRFLQPAARAMASAMRAKINKRPGGINRKVWRRMRRARVASVFTAWSCDMSECYYPWVKR